MKKEIERSFVGTLEARLSEINPLIQIVMGPRQVGKTTGVKQLVNKLPKTQPYHFANADDHLVGSGDWLRLQWQIALEKSPGCLLIVDEVQKIVDWAEVVKSLWDEQGYKESKNKLLLLGSSSLALTKGASESLAGRFELIPIYHWTYWESHQLANLTLEEYLRLGGYPKPYDFIHDYDRCVAYLKNSIIDRVIDKDILQFSQVKKPALFKQAFEILCCYPSQEISYRKILGQIQDKGNTDLVKSYIELFESAFLLKSLQKFSLQDFKVKSSSPKILPLAPCFYSLFCTGYEKEPFVFESTVGATLLQVSKDLYYWRESNLEVDFVLKWRQNIFAIEVKSGRRKRAGGLEAFTKKFSKAICLFITRENYLSFVKHPRDFLQAKV